MTNRPHIECPRCHHRFAVVVRIPGSPEGLTARLSLKPEPPKPPYRPSWLESVTRGRVRVVRRPVDGK